MLTKSGTKESTTQIFRIAKSPLSDAEITAWLQAARQHSFAPYSQFAVSVLFEILLPDDRYAYVLGVNLENHLHNRLSLHAEEVAQNIAQALLGNLPARRIFVMGAPQALQPDSKDPGAKKYITPCGHCRQMLVSHHLPETGVFGVAVAGEIQALGTLATLLPCSFNLDLKSATPEVQGVTASTGSAQFFKAIHPKDLLTRHDALSKEDALQYLRQLSPHLINPEHCTSSVLACILCLSQQESSLFRFRYAVGVVNQDLAFLTTDAIDGALGQANAHFGMHAVQGQIAEIHCHMKEEGSSLTPLEISTLRHFMGSGAVMLHYHTLAGNHTAHLVSPEEEVALSPVAKQSKWASSVKSETW
jgi:cytidine deaminase